MALTEMPITTAHARKSHGEITHLSDVLTRAASEWPAAWVGCTSGVSLIPDRITYSELSLRARRVASGLLSVGLRPGAIIGLVTEDTRQFLTSLWGCVLGGFIPCPVGNVHSGTPRRDSYLRYLQELLDGPVFLKSASQSSESAAVRYIDFESIENAPLSSLVSPGDTGSPALIMLTSGSTGNPKAVVLSHRNLLSGLAAKQSVRNIASSDVFLNWVPFDHITALAESHFLAVYCGASWIHSSARHVLADPTLLLRLITQNGVSISLIPNFLLAQINASLERTPRSSDTRDYDLSKVRHIITGGEANVVATGRRFLALLRPYNLQKHALWPGFGMTETCAGIVYSSDFPDVDAQREFASVGMPVPGVEVRIVDPSDAPVASGQDGALQVKGPMVFQRYHNSAHETERAFTPDGWLRTGDLGRIESGRLVLAGRSKDCIIVNGVNYANQELEAAVEQLADVEPSFCAVFPTRPAGADTEQVVVAFSPNLAPDDHTRLARLCTEVRNTTVLMWGFRPSVLLPLPKALFPRTSLGKIQRSLMRTRFEAGEYKTHQEHLESVLIRQRGLRQAPSSDHEINVAKLFSKLFDLPLDSVSVRDSFFDLGGTSLDIIRLIQEMNGQYPKSNVSISTVLQSPTVQGLARAVDPESLTLKTQYDPIVPLQMTGEEVPLFCIHPASGEVLVFVGLATYFQGERPFYALRARGFNPGEVYFESFHEMVQEYVAAIRRQQAHGPYAIAGYSFGGPVAFEVAKALEAAGEIVPFVGCIDMPPTVPYPFDLVDIAVGFALFLKLIDKAAFETLPATIRNENRDPYVAVLAASREERVRELGLTLETFTSWTQLTFHLVKTILAYAPSGTVDSLTVFRASPLWSTRDEWDAHLRRWEKHARSGVRYVDIEGEHHTLMDGVFLPSFQRALKTAIADAMSTHRGTSLQSGSPFAEAGSPVSRAQA